MKQTREEEKKQAIQKRKDQKKKEDRRLISIREIEQATKEQVQK